MGGWGEVEGGERGRKRRMMRRRGIKMKMKTILGMCYFQGWTKKELMSVYGHQGEREREKESESEGE